LPKAAFTVLTDPPDEQAGEILFLYGLEDLPEFLRGYVVYHLVNGVGHSFVHGRIQSIRPLSSRQNASGASSERRYFSA